MNGLTSVGLPLFRLQNLGCPEHVVQARARAGASAILLFTNEERARRYIDGKKLSGRLRCVPMDESTAARWLVGVETRIASELVVIDADPADVLHPSCEPIDEVLSNLQAVNYGRCREALPVGT